MFLFQAEDGILDAHYGLKFRHVLFRSIVQGGIHEPRLHRSREGGDHDYVFPGNREYVEGDTIPRPRGAAGGGGSEAGTGEGEDEFRFVLTREEYLDMFLDDLELQIGRAHV